MEKGVISGKLDKLLYWKSLHKFCCSMTSCWLRRLYRNGSISPLQKVVRYYLDFCHKYRFEASIQCQLALFNVFMRGGRIVIDPLDKRPETFFRHHPSKAAG